MLGQATLHHLAGHSAKTAHPAGAVSDKRPGALSVPLSPPVGGAAVPEWPHRSSRGPLALISRETRAILSAFSTGSTLTLEHQSHGPPPNAVPAPHTSLQTARPARQALPPAGTDAARPQQPPRQKNLQPEYRLESIISRCTKEFIIILFSLLF